MSGKRRVGGEMLALDGEGFWHEAERPKLYSPGFRHGYQVRPHDHFWEVWWVEYHQTSHHTGISSEQCHGIFSTDRAAELFARSQYHG